MIVKPEVFEQSKQTILKNKYEFLHVHIQQLTNKIVTLKTENNNIKAEINIYKTKPSSLTSRNQIHNNKENQTNNSNKPIPITHRPIISLIITKDITRHHSEEEELRVLEAQCEREQRMKEDYLKELEGKITILKELWENKHSSQTEVKKSLEGTEIATSEKNFRTSLNTSQSSIHPNSQKYSIKTNNLKATKNKSLNQTSLNRKVMSVHLNQNVNANQLLGFHFGKKSINKEKVIGDIGEKIKEREPERRISVGSLWIDSMHTQGGSRSSTNSLNNSLCNSNSRASLLRISSSNSLFKSSMMNLSTCHSQNSQVKGNNLKSYGKIVTKLQCSGCSIEFRPNEYYAHIEVCREFLKVSLIDEKERIEDEINQTLNLDSGSILG